MTIINCQECGEKFTQKWRLLRHHKEEHGGVIETPEEHLPNDTSEQRDFAGETPSEDAHEPEYIEMDEQDGETEESADTRRSSLREWAEEEGDGG